MSIFLMEEQLGHLNYLASGGDGKEKDIFGQMIYHDEDAILSLHYGKPGNEIHRDAIPLLVEDWQWLKQSSR